MGARGPARREGLWRSCSASAWSGRGRGHAGRAAYRRTGIAYDAVARPPAGAARAGSRRRRTLPRRRPTWYFALNVNIKPFNQIKARQAVNLAIDRKEIVRIFGGVAARRPRPARYCRPTFPGYAPYCPWTLGGEAPWSAPDLARATQLVEESGTKGRSRRHRGRRRSRAEGDRPGTFSTCSSSSASTRASCRCPDGVQGRVRAELAQPRRDGALAVAPAVPGALGRAGRPARLRLVRPATSTRAPTSADSATALTVQPLMQRAVALGLYAAAGGGAPVAPRSIATSSISRSGCRCSIRSRQTSCHLACVNRSWSARPQLVASPYSWHVALQRELRDDRAQAHGAHRAAAQARQLDALPRAACHVAHADTERPTRARA